MDGAGRRRRPVGWRGQGHAAANGSRPDRRSVGLICGTSRGAIATTASRDRARMCAGVVPPAPPDDIDQAGLRPLPQLDPDLFRALLVAAKLVRQARVRIRRHQRVGHRRQLRDVGPHQLRAERAVATRQRTARRDAPMSRTRRPSAPTRCGLSGPRSCPRSRSAAPFCLVLEVEDRLQRGLRVQRVEDRLDQEQVHPAVVERDRLLAIRVVDLVEIDNARAGIAHVSRQRQRPVGRTDRPRHPPRRARVGCREAVRNRPREAGRRHVALAHDVLGAVVGLGDRGRRRCSSR